MTTAELSLLWITSLSQLIAALAQLLIALRLRR